MTVKVPMMAHGKKEWAVILDELRVHNINKFLPPIRGWIELFLNDADSLGQQRERVLCRLDA